MKRSEMVKRICELLETQSLQGTAYMYKAEEIVQLLEKNKMAPPLIKVETKTRVWDPHLKEDGDFYQWTMRNKWEEEK